METKHEEDWNNPPETEVRRAKTAMEDELLIKLGVKRENIEFHPLIKHQRMDRANTSLALKYQRVKPPYRERPLWIRNAWRCNNVAMRQMSDLAKRGPRELTLDPAAKSRSRRVPFPAGDPEYHKKRAARFKKLAELLTEWRVYHQMAYEIPEEEQLDIDKLDTLRPISSSTNSSSRRVSYSRQRSSSSSIGTRIKSAKKRTRTMAQKWINMKREMLLNLKAARLKLEKDIPRSEVRIYLSSTPDMAEEREFLAEVAAPELKRYCSKIGLNCHLVDLRTGADRLGNDLSTFKMCEMEIDKCRRLSVGPNFVCLVGEQVDHDLPGFISKEELEEIREVVIKQKIEGVELLDEYYRLDTNLLSPLYELARDDLYSLPDSDEAVETLQECLEEAMQVLRDRGQFGRKTIDFYKWSMCAKEVETGFVGCKAPGNELLCFMKEKNESDEHETSFSHLSTIITRYFENNNCYGNVVTIHRGKKSLNYMRKLCDTFLIHVIRLIDRNLDNQQFYMSDHLSETSDLIQHLQHQKHLLKFYVSPDNQELELKIKDAVENPAYKRTLVICGDEGCGRSAFAAHVAECSVNWDPSTNTVIRFIGRSLRTSTLFHTLISVCKQVAFLYDQITRIPTQATLVEIIRIFRMLLKGASEEVDTGPLVIILDGLENVPDMEPHHVWGLLDDLPLRISLILTVERNHPYLKLLKGSPQGATYFTMMSLAGEDRMNIISDTLKSQDRKMTEDQVNLIVKQLNHEEMPLTITATAAIATHWPSHTLPNLKVLETPVEAFEQLIIDIETGVGAAFTKYALSFLALSRYGLGDSELFHLLLSETELLNELQQENEDLSVLEGYPYQSQLCKFLLWMKPVLDERKVEGESLFVIRHNSLKTAIKKRYLEAEFSMGIHKQLASFFQYTRSGLLLTAKEITEGVGYTLVSQNWRNLRSIPYHMCNSSDDIPGTMKVLKETVLLNMSWIINEIYSGYLNDFLLDMKYIIGCLQLDEDVFLVRRLLLLLRPVIEESPSSLASIVSQFPAHHSNQFNNFIEQAKVWMKQVHSTILIPSPSSGFFSGSFFYGNVTKDSEFFLTSSDGLYLVSFVKGKCEAIELGTGECLASIDATLQKPHVWGKYNLTGIMDNALKTWDILGGKLLRKVPLGINRITWMNVFEDGTVFFASDNQVKRMQAVTGTPAVVIKAPQQIRDAGMSQRTMPTIATLHIQTDWCVRIWETADPQNSETITLEEKPFSTHCSPFHMTNDGKYAVVLYEREAVVLAILDIDVECTLGVDDEVLNVVTFTRSHDHVFLASESGKIKGYLLNSGTDLFTSSVFEKGAKKTKKSTRLISAMATSEDDHFLVVGMTTGMVIVINIPSGQRIQYITSHTDPITQLYYMTDQIHFQHLISLDKQGTAKLWNLQNILRSAREKLFELMWDEDLVKEESEKIDLASYYKLYEKKGKSKMFLNGPDVSAFYNKTDENLFTSGQFTNPGGTGWEQSGQLQDCRQVTATCAAVGRGDIFITYSDENKLAWWDVRRETLLSVRSVAPGGKFFRLRSVFYDQAACLITKDSADRETISVVYGSGKNKKFIQREKVLRCDTSADLKKMATVTVSRQGFKLTTIDISSEQEQRYYLHLGTMAGTLSVDKARVTLSRDLTTVLGFLKVEDRTLIICWNVEDNNPSQQGTPATGGGAGQHAARVWSAASSSADSVQGEVRTFTNMKDLNIKITKSRFYNNQEVLLGNKEGDIYVLDTSNLKITKMFTREGIMACKGMNQAHAKPHRASIRSMYFTPDYEHLLTLDATKICVWNMRRKILVYAPAAGDKMANAVLSKEGCFTLAGLTTGIVRLWANYHRKLLYSFRIPSTLHHVALTPDNARVLALVDENSGTRVVVFETKNTDDYILEKTENDAKTA